MNNEDLSVLGIKFETRTEYAIEYIEEILKEYRKQLRIDENTFVYGKGKRKTTYQRKYETLKEYKEKLERYAKHIEICGEKRESYSKTDQSATFMRIKRDYMGNDQLLPAYNMQVAVCDEYIATVDVKQYATDTECFVPLMEKFMKFTMFEKETKDKKYRDNPYRAVNFARNEEGKIVCPKGRRFNLKYVQHVKGNKYGRTEEIYECESCANCEYKEDCCPKTKNNRTIRLNRELTVIHKEVLKNLCSIQGALLCMNRSIQAEGTYGIIKWDKNYKRLRRKGLKSVILELTLICCGFNLYKYHKKINRIKKCA